MKKSLNRWKAKEVIGFWVHQLSINETTIATSDLNALIASFDELKCQLVAREYVRKCQMRKNNKKIRMMTITKEYDLTDLVFLKFIFFSFHLFKSDTCSVENPSNKRQKRVYSSLFSLVVAQRQKALQVVRKLTKFSNFA